MNKAKELKKSFLSSAKKLLPESLKNELDIRFRNYQKVFDANELNKFHLEQFANSRVVLEKDFIANLFSALYEKIDPNQIVPHQNMAHAKSFIAYYHGCTTILLYNFFSKNYGIRDPILYRFVGMLKAKPIFVFNKLLLADQVMMLKNLSSELNSKELPEHCSVVIQAFHPRIKTPADQLRFFAVYHDPKQGIVSGIHSMQLSSSGHDPKWNLSLRSYGFPESPAFVTTLSNSHCAVLADSQKNQETLSKFRSNDSLIGQNAYLTHENSEGIPLAIWHDGPSEHLVKLAQNKRKLGSCQTAFFVPDFSMHAPVLLFSKSQIGFYTNKVSISAFNLNHQLIAAEEACLSDENASVDLRDLFRQHQLSGPVVFIVDFLKDIGEFQSPPQCYLHIYYRSRNRIGDQVHSDYSVGYWNDSLQRLRSYRCRKFAPLINNPRLKFIYSIINVGGVKLNPDHSVSVRIITDKRIERVIKVEVPSGGFGIIHGESLIAAIDSQIDHAAVVQLEHETTNYNGMWFCTDQISHHLGVDHFTGG